MQCSSAPPGGGLNFYEICIILSFEQNLRMGVFHLRFTFGPRNRESSRILTLIKKSIGSTARSTRGRSICVESFAWIGRPESRLLADWLAETQAVMSGLRTPDSGLPCQFMSQGDRYFKFIQSPTKWLPKPKITWRLYQEMIHPASRFNPFHIFTISFYPMSTSEEIFCS